MFECFNVPGTKKGRNEDASAYASAGARVGLGWVMSLVIGLGVVGTVVGSV
jgi:hypothetical protein